MTVHFLYYHCESSEYALIAEKNVANNFNYCDIEKNDKLKILPNANKTIEEPTDILINGLGFVRITKPGDIRVYALDSKLVSYRKSMI